MLTLKVRAEWVHDSPYGQAALTSCCWTSDLIITAVLSNTALLSLHCITVCLFVNMSMLLTLCFCALYTLLSPFFF